MNIGPDSGLDLEPLLLLAPALSSSTPLHSGNACTADQLQQDSAHRLLHDLGVVRKRTVSSDGRYACVDAAPPPERQRSGSAARERLRSLSTVYEIDNVPTNSANLTTFLLLNAMIGSGILNQPYVFMKSGMVGGTLAFLLAGGMTCLGLMLLTSCAIKMNCLEYSGLAGVIFGKAGETTVDVSILIVCLGSLLGYILVVGLTISNLLQSWGCEEDYCGTMFVTAISISTLVSPFVLFRHFGHFAWISVFSIIAIVAVLLLVVIGGPMKEEKGSIELLNITGALQSTGSIIFSLSCASSNLQAFVSTEHKSQSLQTWGRVTGSAVAMGALMCMCMGVAGYYSFRGETEGEILDNFEGSQFDFFKIMVATHLILYIPINFVVMRYSIVKMASGLKSESLNQIPHTLLSLGLLAFCTIIVLLLNLAGIAGGEGFGVILNITGGIGGSLSSFIIPAAMYAKVMPASDPLYYPAIALGAMGVVILVTVVIVTILGLL
jgi:amino acid permease